MSPLKRDLFIWALLAGAGGMAHFLATRIEEGAKEMPINKFVFLLFANIFISGFSGLMGALTMSMVTDMPEWHFVSAGVFGFLGAKGIEILADKLTQKIQ